MIPENQQAVQLNVPDLRMPWLFRNEDLFLSTAFLVSYGVWRTGLRTLLFEYTANTGKSLPVSICSNVHRNIVNSMLDTTETLALRAGFSVQSGR